MARAQYTFMNCQLLPFGAWLAAWVVSGHLRVDCLELDANHVPRVGTTLTVADAALKRIFELFASFSGHLGDTPGGDSFHF